MADALASGASARLGRGGSTPLSRTSFGPSRFRSGGAFSRPHLEGLALAMGQALALRIAALYS